MEAGTALAKEVEVFDESPVMEDGFHMPRTSSLEVKRMTLHFKAGQLVVATVDRSLEKLSSRVEDILKNDPYGPKP